jgi:hypothetical protein
MFLLYHSDRCNTSETVFHWCYVNDLHTTHAVVCWVTTSPRSAADPFSWLAAACPAGGGSLLPGAPPPVPSPWRSATAFSAHEEDGGRPIPAARRPRRAPAEFLCAERPPPARAQRGAAASGTARSSAASWVAAPWAASGTARDSVTSWTTSGTARSNGDG